MYPIHVIYSAVQTEVITLAEAKTAIKIDSTDFEDNITVTSCVTGGYHVVSASATDGYIVDTYAEPGRVFLAYNSTWPSFTGYPYNALEIIYTCGYTSTTVPKKIKDAILKMIGLLHENRVNGIPIMDLQAVDNLLQSDRIHIIR